MTNHRERSRHSWLRNRGGLEDVLGKNISLIITGLVIIIITILGSAAYLKMKTWQNNILVGNLRDSTQQVYAAKSSYGTEDITPVLLKGEHVYSFFVKDNGSEKRVESAFGSEVHVVGDNDKFFIYLDQLDDAQCLDISNNYMGGDSSLDSAQINGSDVDTPVSPTSAANLCSSGDGGNSVALGYR